MFTFDTAQQRVLGLSLRDHARVLGAPGSGKTELVVESYARLLDTEGVEEASLLVIAPNRLVASQLRAQIERRTGRALGGTPVRTAASLAFAMLSRDAAARGVNPPRLLTGTVQDEAIADAVDALLADRTEPLGLADEVLLSPAFRAELRELSRVIDAYGLDLHEFARRLSTLEDVRAARAHTDAPAADLIDRWILGLRVLDAAEQRLRAERPDELSSSALLRTASETIAAGQVPVPKLVLVDDAQELGEGQLALLAALATSGSSIWAFGNPDTATGAFQGERARVLSGVTAELERRGYRSEPGAIEQVVVLDRVYRHGRNLRTFIGELETRIGAANAGEQRSAEAAEAAADRDSVEFAIASSTPEQLGMIAHRMRARKLGLDTERNEAGGHTLHWGDMAVICRSRSEANRVARALAAQQVPTGIAAGGLVLREHQVVRELIALLQHALGLREVDAQGVLALAGGVIGGLDPVAVRRLRGSLLLQERRIARIEEREPDTIEEIVHDAFLFPGGEPVIDSAGGRAIRRLGRMASAGKKSHESGGTARETLWAIWEAAKLAENWQIEALDGRGIVADEANRSLDAVMGLFFALQRHEEQASEQPIAELLDDILQSTVPEDSLAGRSERDSVTVTTPQGVIGREFALVAVVGLQDGAWPNLRARGSMLGTTALERWLRGGAAEPPSRRDTIHDELRLLAQSCSRARDELLVVAVSDEDSHPSAFFGLGSAHRVETLPSSRVTLRGATAEMRRRAVRDLTDAQAVESLAILADAGVSGAHPDEWYGIMPPSTERALYAQDGEEPERIPVSPSQLETAETCALDWVIGALGGGSGSVQASLGTLVHHALETADGHDPETLLAAIMSEWRKLPFDAEWESERSRRTAAAMARGLADYLSVFEASDRELLGRETSFSLDIGRAQLRGIADRIEARKTPDGVEITVVDLKTGRTPATIPAAEEHVQLQAYQLGVALGAFELAPESDPSESHPEEITTAAKLLYVHPDAAKGKSYIERSQSELSAEARDALIERVNTVAHVMAAGQFTARIEHHCSDPFQPGNCRLHIIQAVSHA